MHVVFLGMRGFPNVQGGVEIHCENLTQHLVSKGIQVTVLTRRSYCNPVQPYFQGVRMVALPDWRNKYLEVLLHTFIGVFKARLLKADVLHLHCIAAGLFSPLARLLGMKVIVTHHALDYKHQKWGKLAYKFLRFSEWVTAKFANQIIVVSKIIQAVLMNEYGRASVVVPNGVPTPSSVQQSDILEKLGLKPQRYLMIVGRIVEGKGIEDLIPAFINYCKSNPETDWKLAIVGGVDHPSEFQRNILQQAAKSDRIVLSGFQTGGALKDLFRSCGIFVMASYEEGLPVSLLEAMSFGTPYIITDLEALQNIDYRFNPEYMFQPGDVQRLTDLITRETSRLNQNWQRDLELVHLVKRDYNWESIADQTIDLYNKLI